MLRPHREESSRDTRLAVKAGGGVSERCVSRGHMAPPPALLHVGTVLLCGEGTPAGEEKGNQDQGLPSEVKLRPLLVSVV